jgi:hypothetical protein
VDLFAEQMQTAPTNLSKEIAAWDALLMKTDGKEDESISDDSEPEVSDDGIPPPQTSTTLSSSAPGINEREQHFDCKEDTDGASDDVLILDPVSKPPEGLFSSIMQNHAQKSAHKTKDAKREHAISDEEEEEESDPIVDHNWWRLARPAAVTCSDLSESDMLGLGNKVVAFLHLLALSINEGDKMVLFSQSLSTLTFLEMLLCQTQWGKLVEVQPSTPIRFLNWSSGRQYMRIDGSTSDRQALIEEFNGRDTCKLFMISTRAGNMGINLQSANRVVVFDSSWNPANDLQAIFRCYRYGQKKKVFIYRFLASGSMEEKIYKQQVAKQARSSRVVDAQMPENQFTSAEKSELMTFVDDDGATKATSLKDAYRVLDSGIQVRYPRHRRCSSIILCFCLFPICVTYSRKDKPLRELLEKRAHMFVAIEDHQRLLEDKEEHHLDEREKREAELEYLRDAAAMSAPPPMQLPEPSQSLFTHTFAPYFTLRPPTLSMATSRPHFLPAPPSIFAPPIPASYFAAPMPAPYYTAPTPWAVAAVPTLSVPTCPNVVNPFHQCSEYCSARYSQTG